MSKSACKCQEAEECECPEWIFTFADLVMLMMGFFVVLWVIKPPAGNPNAAEAAVLTDQYLETIGEIKVGFGGWEPNPASADPVDRAMLKRRARLGEEGPGGRSNNPHSGAEGTDPEVTNIRKGSQAAVGGRVLFDRNDFHVNSEATNLLDQIANEIRGHRNIVLVKGHSSLDDFPDGASAEQRMDLSLKRAQRAAEHLRSRGVDADVLRIQGCSTFEPVVEKVYTPNAQVQNRRVEVEVTASLVAEFQDSSATKPITSPAPVAPSPQPHSH